MKEILSIIAFIACLPCLAPPAGQSGRAGARESVRKVFMEQVGVRELTGNNDGVQVERYLKTCGLDAGAPWCAAFVNWVFWQCGIAGPEKLPAYCPSWFKQEVPENSPPQPGDVFGIYYPARRRIAHMGFIAEYGMQYTVTVEGNTTGCQSACGADRDGNGVVKKRRLTRQIYRTADWITYREKAGL